MSHTLDGLVGSRWGYIVATILKVWRRIKNPTPSVDAHLIQRTVVPNCIPIWFETTATEPWAFLKSFAPTVPFVYSVLF